MDFFYIPPLTLPKITVRYQVNFNGVQIDDNDKHCNVSDLAECINRIKDAMIVYCDDDGRYKDSTLNAYLLIQSIVETVLGNQVVALIHFDDISA